jgi:predicted ribosomally synthesized peptide with SipW-like signal peptide
MIKKKRLFVTAGSIASIGAIAALASGVTFGLFSDTAPIVDSPFNAGTVSLTQAAATSCTVSNIQPGDSGSCEFTVNYIGSVSDGVWLGVDLAITAPVAGSPVQEYAPGNSGTTPIAAAGLYDSTARGLQVSVTDNQSPSVTYMSGTDWNGSATRGVTPSIDDLLVNTAAITTDPTPVVFTISWSLPFTAGNDYDGAASTIEMIVHAVQAGHNGSTTSCTAGDVCAGITGWS